MSGGLGNMYRFIRRALLARQHATMVSQLRSVATFGESVVFEGQVEIKNESGDKSAIEVGHQVRLVNANLKCKTGARLKIGSFCVVQDDVSVVAARSVDIGNFVGIAAGGLVSDNNTHAIGAEHWIRHRIRTAPDGPGYPGLGDGIELSDCAPVVIGDCVWLGTNASVIKGVTVGEGSIIARSAVVTKNVEPYSVVAGNPGKVVRKLDPPAKSIRDTAIDLLAELEFGEAAIERLKADYAAR